MKKLLVMLLVSFFVFANAAAETSKEAFAKDSSVMVSGETQLGSGFIIGEDESWVYLATAWHVVRENEFSDVFGETFVEFKNAPDFMIPAQLASPKSYVVDEAVDLAILKIKKSSDLTILMPKIGRVFSTERPKKVKFIGRKSQRQKWQITPTFEVENYQKSKGKIEQSYAVNTFFSLNMFSGGAVFDDAWRLVGMTISGGGLSDDFRTGEFTNVVKLSVLIEHFKYFSIPLAPYLKQVEEGELPEYLITESTQQAMQPMFIGQSTSIVRTIYKTGFNPIFNIENRVGVKVREKWVLLDSDPIAELGLNSITERFSLESETTAFKACVSNKLSTGGFSYHLVTVDDVNQLSNLPTRKASENSVRTQLLYTMDSNPCDSLFEGVDSIKEAESQRLTALGYMQNPMSANGIYPKSIIFGVSEFGRGSHKMEIVLPHQHVAVLTDNSDFRTYVMVKYKGKEERLFKLTSKNRENIVFTTNITEQAEKNIKNIETCMVTSIANAGWLGVNQEYTQTANNQMSMMLSGIKPNLTFIAEEKHENFEFKINDDPSKVCSFQVPTTLK